MIILKEILLKKLIKTILNLNSNMIILKVRNKELIMKNQKNLNSNMIILKVNALDRKSNINFLFKFQYDNT